MLTNDYEAIRTLSYTYTFLLDDGDFAAVGELLADAVLQPAMPGVLGDEIRGREAVENFYRSQVVTYKNGRPMTRHLITNQAIDLDAANSTATARCYFTVLQRPPQLPYQIVVGGQYFDRFVKIGDEWRFAAKTIHVEHLNEIKHHFRIADVHSSSDV